jgi:flavin-dependent dehydrogenase
MSNRFDVVIVGAGPAGLKCAEQFLNSNLSVLLIEKNEIIGPKVCAGGLTFSSNSFGLPEAKTRSFNELIFCVPTKKRKINLLHPIRTIDRYDLGQFLLERIKDSKNVTILKGTTVRQIAENKISTNKGDFYYKYLVGADGSCSVVRKYLKLKSEFATGLCYKIDKITDDFAFYFSPEVLNFGYIWSFPHRNYTHVGIYFNPKYIFPKKAKEILDDFLKENSFIPSQPMEAAPISFLYQGYVFNNIFLAGDAAGLASELSGEGISYAMISGQDIGRKILDPGYDMAGLRKILKIRGRQDKTLKVLGIINKSLFLRKSSLRLLLTLADRAGFQKYLGI